MNRSVIRLLCVGLTAFAAGCGEAPSAPAADAPSPVLQHISFTAVAEPAAGRFRIVATAAGRLRRHHAGHERQRRDGRPGQGPALRAERHLRLGWRWPTPRVASSPLRGDVRRRRGLLRLQGAAAQRLYEDHLGERRPVLLRHQGPGRLFRLPLEPQRLALPLCPARHRLQPASAFRSARSSGGSSSPTTAPSGSTARSRPEIVPAVPTSPAVGRQGLRTRQAANLGPASPGPRTRPPTAPRRCG